MALLLASCLVASLTGLARSREFAVARPFATSAEISNFQRSFDAWNSMVPCAGATSHPVDLYLVYSRPFSASSTALAAASRIATEFEGKSQAWHACFRNVHLLSANLTAEEDQYDTFGQDTNPNWVSGPNNVFRYVLKQFLGKSNYDAFFFMELDSFPKRELWLDQFLRETAVPGVAIRGSRYRGDKWDHFLTELPEAILAHINGNAIYFPKHPLLRWLGEQLDIDARTSMASVAFDVRMAQLVLDAKTSPLWSSLAPLGADPYLSDSKLIGNYAGTLLNSSFDGGEYITHVAKSNIFEELDSAKVTLAVSHFSATNFSVFSESVPTHHPFREIQMLTKDPNALDGSVDEIATPRGTTRMTWKKQTGPTNMTLCELAQQVTTEFFVFTDTYHAISSPVSVLMDGPKPLLPFMLANSRYCATDGRCTDSLEQARELFGVSLDRHYETFDTLFITAQAKDFCAAWMVAERALLSRDSSLCLPVTGPSADDYIAWLSTKGDIAQWYRLENREQKGWREFTLLHTAHPVDPRPCGQYGPAQYQSTVSNISSCSLYLEQPGDCNADSACMWRPIFTSGKCVPSLGDGSGADVAFEDWTVTTTAPATTARTAAPTATAAPLASSTTTTTPAPTSITQTGTSITGTETTTGTTLPAGFLTATTTTTIPLSKFASCVLKLNTKIPLKVLVRKVKKGALMQIQRARNSKVKKVVITMEIESQQLSSIFVKIVLTLQKRSRGLRALKKAYCKSLGPERCEVSKRGENGLAKKRLAGRKLQADNELPFEAFAVLSTEVEVDEINELKDNTFMPALTAALADEFPDETFATVNATALGPLNEEAEAILSYSIPETDAADVAELQGEVANTSEIALALADAESSDAILAPPAVDLCLARDCGGHGSCVWGICTCEPGWWGVNCLLKAPVADSAFSVTVPVDGEQIPLIVSMSLLATCLIWVLPCLIIYCKKKRNEAADNNNKQLADDDSTEKNRDLALEVGSSESDDAFI